MAGMITTMADRMEELQSCLRVAARMREAQRRCNDLEAATHSDLRELVQLEKDLDQRLAELRVKGLT